MIDKPLATGTERDSRPEGKGLLEAAFDSGSTRGSPPHCNSTELHGHSVQVDGLGM